MNSFFFLVANMKVLITGGLGYIGSHLAIELSEKGYQVEIVDRRPLLDLDPQHAIALTKHNCRISHYHTEAVEFYNDFKDHTYDVIYHFAEEKVIDQIETDAQYLNRITESAYNIAKLRKNNCKVIYSSSGAVYGKYSKYKQGKSTIELLLGSVIPNLTILRFGNPIGCYGDLSYRFFKGNALAERLLQLKKDSSAFPLITDDKGNSTTRAYVFIKDLLDCCTKAINLKDDVIDVGTHNLTTREFVEKFIKYNKLSNTIEHVPLRLGETHSIKFNSEAIDINWERMMPYIQ